MNQPAAQSSSQGSVILLSQLLLPPKHDILASSETRKKLKWELSNLCRDDFDDMVTLAQTNHVIRRGLETFLDLMLEEGDSVRAGWAESALAVETARIDTAIKFLQEICAVFDEHKFDVTVIKSLDHWPDLGSDLDLYTNATPEEVSRLMSSCFSARMAARSWGDRLAHKWNFLLPGLPEAVEVHIGRLGQTGEQIAVASAIAARSRLLFIKGHAFRVPSVADRLAISTLQRMYRHFYFRLCDVVDSAALADAGSIDFENLRATAKAAGIWEGVATYLVIVSDYVERYRGSGLDLPKFVTVAARFRGDEVYYARGFLRVPIMPQSARLYGAQLAGVFARGELQNGVRLSLLPWLAAAAVVGQKLTGSDKGIW